MFFSFWQRVFFVSAGIHLESSEMEKQYASQVNCQAQLNPGATETLCHQRQIACKKGATSTKPQADELTTACRTLSKAVTHYYLQLAAWACLVACDVLAQIKSLCFVVLQVHHGMPHAKT